ncbi:MAG: hypothetical protein SFV18_07540 [Bryobacteraceae bacterium]|nr:hypothetical protein [Bryobacteraceae bacterium]
MSQFKLRAFLAAALLAALGSLSVWAAALPGTPDGGGTFPKPKPACLG